MMAVKSSRKIKLADIAKKSAEFIESRKFSNNLIDLLRYLEADDVKILLAAVRAVHKVCIHVINSGELSTAPKSLANDDNSDKEMIYLSWLKDRYTDCCRQLCTLLSHENSSVQDLSLCTLLKFVKTEGQVAIAASASQPFPVTLLQQIIKTLLHSDEDLSQLIAKFQEFMEFDDVRYFAMKTAVQHIKSQSAGVEELSSLNLVNTFALLQNLSLKESVNDDILSNFLVVVPGGSNITKLSSHKQHKLLFQAAWLEFLKHKLPRSLYHKVLVVLDDKVMPFMVNPLQLSDFLTQSYNIGGATSLLALNGLFRLIHGYNLDYPDFYGKLYALLEPTIFHVKYRARFLYLLDLFLTSTHLPAYLVAAFIKRLCRLCLSAPPHGLTAVIPLVYNLILRHDACKVLIHRPGVADAESDPYDETETNPSKCRALESSLWELKSLTQHYHYSISNEAKKMEQPLPKQETDLASLLDTNMDDLITKEKKKKLKVVSKTFDVPNGLFGVRGSCLAELWKWGAD